VSRSVIAPDFSLFDTQGNPRRLADFRSQRHVVLVFNRGFQ
jgi:peroxiredoxin